jgi:hypothetical protein
MRDIDGGKRIRVLRKIKELDDIKLYHSWSNSFMGMPLVVRWLKEACVDKHLHVTVSYLLEVRAPIPCSEGSTNFERCQFLHRLSLGSNATDQYVLRKALVDVQEGSIAGANSRHPLPEMRMGY